MLLQGRNDSGLWVETSSSEIRETPCGLKQQGSEVDTRKILFHFKAELLRVFCSTQPWAVNDTESGVRDALG